MYLHKLLSYELHLASHSLISKVITHNKIRKLIYYMAIYQSFLTSTILLTVHFY